MPHVIGIAWLSLSTNWIERRMLVSPRTYETAMRHSLDVSGRALRRSIMSRSRPAMIGMSTTNVPAIQIERSMDAVVGRCSSRAGAIAGGDSNVEALAGDGTAGEAGVAIAAGAEGVRAGAGSAGRAVAGR